LQITPYRPIDIPGLLIGEYFLEPAAPESIAPLEAERGFREASASRALAHRRALSRADLLEEEIVKGASSYFTLPMQKEEPANAQSAPHSSCR
jgi:hypothetical protein